MKVASVIKPSLGGALAVIFRHEIVGYITRNIRTHPRQRREDHAMREFDRADLDW